MTWDDLIRIIHDCFRGEPVKTLRLCHNLFTDLDISSLLLFVTRSFTVRLSLKTRVLEQKLRAWSAVIVSMDYSKFEHLDESKIHDTDLGASVSKKPRWTRWIEENSLKLLEASIEDGSLNLAEQWTGERHCWRTAGNFADESESGTYTPLGIAVLWNKTDVVELFLKHGADTETTIIVNGAERTLMSIAKGRNMRKIVKLISK